MAKTLKIGSTGKLQEETSVGVSAGAADAGKLPHLDGAGKLDSSLLVLATGAVSGLLSTTDYNKLQNLAANASTAYQPAGSYAASSHTHSDATGSASGFLTATDYNKLQNLAANANTAYQAAGSYALSSSVPSNAGTTPTAIAAAGSAGTAGAYARETHTHAHGDQAGSATVNLYHAAATGTLYGFLSPTDFNKLANLAANAGTAYQPAGSYASTALATSGASGLLSSTDFNKLANLAANANTAYQAAGSYASTAVVTTSVNGLMIAADKSKLDGVAAGATNTAAPPTNSGAVPAVIGGSGSAGTAGTYAREDHMHNHGDQAGFNVKDAFHAAATSAKYGFLSPADYDKLQNLAANASTAYQPTGSYASTALATGSTSGLLAAADFNKLQNLAANASTAYQPAGSYASTAVVTTSVNGLMIAADKSKLDGVAAGATNTAAPPTWAGTTPADIGTAAAGSSASYAASNHVHGHGNQAGSASVNVWHAAATGSVYGFMSPSDFTKLSGIAAGATNTAAPPAAPGAAPLDISSGASVGTAGTYATANHGHNHGNLGGSGSVNVYHGAASGSVYGFLSPTDYNKLQNLAANANGSYQAAGSYASTAVVTTGANGLMIAADKSKLDGIAAGATNTAAPPAAPGAAPPDIGAAAAVGTVGTYATATHTHFHGYLAGGTYHADASTGASGFMSAADKTKLDLNPGPVNFPGGMFTPAGYYVHPGELKATTIGLTETFFGAGGGGAALLAQGTGTAFNLVPRIQFGSGTGANATVGTQTPSYVCRSQASSKTGGFFFSARFCCPTAATYNHAFYVGLVPSGWVDGQDPGSLANIVGFYRSASSGASGGIKRCDASNPVHDANCIPSSMVNGIDMFIYARRGSTTVSYGWRDYGTETWTNTAAPATYFPTYGTMLKVLIWSSAGSTGVSTRIELGHFMIGF